MRKDRAITYVHACSRRVAIKIVQVCLVPRIGCNLSAFLKAGSSYRLLLSHMAGQPYCYSAGVSQGHDQHSSPQEFGQSVGG